MQVCVCGDFFLGRGLLESPSKSTGSKVSIPKDCSKIQRLQLSPSPCDLLTTWQVTYAPFKLLSPFLNFFFQVLPQPKCMAIVSSIQLDHYKFSILPLRSPANLMTKTQNKGSSDILKGMRLKKERENAGWFPLGTIQMKTFAFRI